MNHETCKQKAKDLETQIQEVVAELQASGLYDARSLAVAKTQLETGMLWLAHSMQKNSDCK